jgi:hypothetical protein
MADPILLQVPMRETADVTKGEVLHIHFTTDCCFCSDTTEEYFDKPLPIGDHKAGDKWHGTATKTGTISFHHTEYGSGCDTKRFMDAGRTITIGD